METKAKLPDKTRQVNSLIIITVKQFGVSVQ